MVNLQYVSNPFDAKMMNSISCFYEERSFYDCINRRFLNDQAFRHLENSFYTYFLTGDCGEWIGYVLFSNEKRVDAYYQYASQITLDLLNKFKVAFGNCDNQKELERLEQLLYENHDSSNIRIILDDVEFSLKKLGILNFLKEFPFEINHVNNQQELEKMKKIIMEDSSLNDIEPVIDKMFFMLGQLGISQFDLVNEMFLDYQNQLQNYLNQLPNYFYLDVVIALPKDEEIKIKKENSSFDFDVDKLVELKYYGFIREAFTKVEAEIRQKFKDTPIFLREENKKVFLANGDDLIVDKQVVKQILNII